MSMTTNKNSNHTGQATDSSEVLPMIQLIVSASVQIIDRTGTAVEAQTIGKAIRMIRRRHHDEMPMVTLHDTHQQDRLFTPGPWLISPSQILPVDHHDSTGKTPDYWLLYHGFTLHDPSVPENDPKPVKPGALLTIATTAADSSNQAVHLDSNLLGFNKPTFNPGDGLALSKAEEEDSSSVLDGLDRGLFTPPPPPTEEAPDNSETTEEERLDEDAPDLETEAFGVEDLPGLLDEDTSETEELYDPDGPLSDSKELVPSEEDPEESKPGFFRKHQRNALIAVITLLAITGVVILYRIMVGGSNTQEPAPATPGWVSQAPAISAAEEPLTAGYDQQLWELDAETAANLSWFEAGAAYIDPENGNLVLIDRLTGEEIAATMLRSPVEYTAEFMAGDVPAVGARTEEDFRVITAEGETASWDLEESDTLRVSGSTPMITTEDGETFALVIGEEDPVEVTGNPQLHSAAIDGETLIQVAGGEPTVVTIPMTDDADHDPAEIDLEAPEGAAFVQHLTVGHGRTLTVWEHQDKQYLLVHSLQDDGELTAAVEAPEEISAWAIGRGMDLAIVGDHAFDLDTGELVASSEHGLVSALGPAAVTASEERQFLLDGTSYTEDQRIIGYTGEGTALVRMPDGSVRGLGESAGQI